MRQNGVGTVSHRTGRELLSQETVVLVEVIRFLECFENIEQK